eukprot:Em0011g1078a
MATTTKPYKLFHVPTHRVGVYLCQPGTQRHARIRNTGGVTTTTKYFQAHQWRWVPFFPVQLYLYGSYFVMTCTRDQAVRATEGKVADHVQEDTSTHLDGEIKEEGANDVETVVKDQVIVSTKIVWMKGLVMVWMKGLVMVWMKGLSDGVDEGPSGGVNDSVNEGPCDGVDERPSDEGPSDGPSDGEEKILLYLYLTGSTKILKYI